MDRGVPDGRDGLAGAPLAGRRDADRVYCIRMARPKTNSSVLTLRVPAKVHRYLTREARRRRRTRSDIARSILQERVEGLNEPDFFAEARRQSLLVSRRRSERETLAFLDAVADRSGWK